MVIPESRLEATAVRRVIIQQAFRAGVGHIGSALSIADLLTAIYSHAGARLEPHGEDRDRFILSKGHAALALYAILHLKGCIDERTLNTYCGDGSLLGVHPERDLCGVDFGTGSLGHGLSYGAGAALAARLSGSERRVFVLMSDAECNEGSVWESVMFAAHHRLSNLVAAVDVNGQQALGYTRDVLALEPLADKWRAFGWRVHETDGHDARALAAALRATAVRANAPHVLLARTTFGKGVSYMQDRIEWHYLPMTADQYASALAEIDACARNS